MNDLPETKKDLYFKIRLYNKGLIGIVGARQVGKTILLRQLANDLGGIYITAENYLFLEDDGKLSENIMNKVIDAINSDAKLICLDEITLLNRYHLTTICSIIRNINYNKREVLILFTGSYPADIIELNESMGRGRLFNLYDLTFAEFCRWNSITTPSELDLINYFKFSFLYKNDYGVDDNDMLSRINSLKEFMNMLLICAKKSWLKRNTNNLSDKFFKNPNTLTYIIDYIREMCEFSIVKTSKGNKAKSIKHLEDFLDSVNSIEERNRIRAGSYVVTGEGSPIDNNNVLTRIPLKDLKNIQYFMYTSKLGLPYSNISISDNSFVADIDKTKLISAFPWLLAVFNDEYHDTITETRMSELIEYYFLLTMIEIGYNAGTYRDSNNDYEIDVVAIDPIGNTVLIECKYQNYDNISDDKFYRYATICANANLNEYFITSRNISMDRNISVTVNNVNYTIVAHVRKIADLLLELSERVYCKKIYNKGLTNLFGENK